MATMRGPPGEPGLLDAIEFWFFSFNNCTFVGKDGRDGKDGLAGLKGDVGTPGSLGKFKNHLLT